MKYLAIFFVCLLAVSASASTIKTQLKQTSDNGVKESFEVVGGFLVGAFGSYTHIQECFDESSDIFNHFKTAFADLRQKDLKGVRAGLKEIGAALVEVPKAVRDCKDIENIVKKVKGLATLFANPTMLVVDIGKNIFWHSKDIFKEVIAAINAHDNEQWFEMGRQIGIIADQVFLSSEQNKALTNHGIDFFEGTIHGLDATYFDEVKVCVDDISDETYNKIVADLKDMSWKNIERSVKDAEDIVHILSAVVGDCKPATRDADAFVKKLVAAIKKTDFAKEALNIMKHPLKFYRMVENIQKDITKDDYFDAGDLIGEFVAEVLHLDS